MVVRSIKTASMPIDRMLECRVWLALAKKKKKKGRQRQAIETIYAPNYKDIGRGAPHGTRRQSRGWVYVVVGLREWERPSLNGRGRE